MISDIRNNYIENFFFKTHYNDIFKGKFFGQKRPQGGINSIKKTTGKKCRYREKVKN